MAKIKVEVFCNKCNEDANIEDITKSYNCPKCGSRNIIRMPFVECEHCGREVPLTNFTNCCDCGQLYNISGQNMGKAEGFDEEAKVVSFGPLDYMN